MASGSRTGAVEVAHELSAAPLDILGELIERYADDPRKQVIHAVEVARRRQARLKADHERVLGMYELMHELAGDGFGVRNNIGCSCGSTFYEHSSTKMGPLSPGLLLR